MSTGSHAAGMNSRIGRFSGRRWGGLALALLAFLGFSSIVVAQPAPRLTSISPEWIQRGTTLEVTLTGENLGAVTQILFNGDPGLSATNVAPSPVAAPKSTVVVESTGGGITRAEAALPKRDEKKRFLGGPGVARGCSRRRE
jgi:hypothetical protein